MKVLLALQHLCKGNKLAETILFGTIPISANIVLWFCWRSVMVLYSGTLCRPPLTGYAALTSGLCLEFWLNRYQTLLGAGAALAAAWIAWRASQQNIARVDRGLVLSRQQISAAALPLLIERRRMLYELREMTDASEGAARGPWVYEAKRQMKVRKQSVEGLKSKSDYVNAITARSLPSNLYRSGVDNENASKKLADIYREHTLSPTLRTLLAERVHWQNSLGRNIRDLGKYLDKLQKNQTDLPSPSECMDEADLCVRFIDEIYSSNKYGIPLSAVDAELRSLDGVIDGTFDSVKAMPSLTN